MELSAEPSVTLSIFVFSHICFPSSHRKTRHRFEAHGTESRKDLARNNEHRSGIPLRPLSEVTASCIGVSICGSERFNSTSRYAQLQKSYPSPFLGR
jgi:hypothetical protein